MRGDVVSLGSWGGLGRWVRVAIAACAALVATPALAQPTPEEIAASAVNRIHQAAMATVENLGAARVRAIVGIEALDRQGAPDARIIAFGQKAIEALQRIGQAGRDRISTIRGRAVAALQALSAPQALIDQVNAAAQTGRQAISQAQQRCVQDVRDAVAEAIGPP